MVSPSHGSNRRELVLATGSSSDEQLETTDEGDAITLENFDETDAEAHPILTSPRSIEACRMLGVEPEELIHRPLEYFLQLAKGGHTEDRDLVAKRAARFEKNRRVQLHNVRAQRLELVEAQEEGVHGSMSLRTRSYCHSPEGATRLYNSAGAGSSSFSQREFTVIEREKKELERIQRRQALEMQQLLNFELRMAELHRERERKELEQKRQDDLLAKQRQRSQREADEQRRRKEIQKAEQHRLELEQARKEAQQRQMESMRREQLAKQDEARRQRDAQQGEKERQRRQEEARIQNELYQLAQEREAVRKAQEMASREAQRQAQRERQKRAKAQELAEKQERNSARVSNVLQDKDLLREAQLEAAARKQQKSEERRLAVEEERQAKEEEARLQALRKKETIEGVQNQLAVMEEQRRERLREQERQAEMRLQQREREKQQQLEVQRREEQRMERERQRVYERMELQLHRKQSSILNKTEEKAMTAQMMQNQKHALVRARLQEAKLREEEIQAALRRKTKQDEYRTKLLLSRIESDNQRTRQLKEQRASLIRRRQQIKQTASRQKHEILESFYKMKITKKFELPKHLAASIIVEERAHSASASKLQTRSLSAADDPLASEQGAAPRAARAARRPVSATARRPRGASATWNHRPATSRVYASPLDDGDDEEEGDNEGLNSGDGMDDASHAEAVSDLRRQQNEELLHVLKEEHHAEEQREHLLRQASADRRERVRMEQLFDTERAHASERIMQLTDRHERALAAKMDELRAGER
ncbi:hypothetical protein BBJ28_00017959 [Nothophytophthora sp. Chile5]|nr:hypothetical protein BBJ28_00017959 [Nothophytophthora sp. Chile5]